MQSHFANTRIARVVNALVLVVVGMLAQSAAGATYYVSTTGNDTNPGTLSSPWRTIQHAANTAMAGATVYVMGGTYNESVSFPHSGSPGQLIRFESYPGQTALISGSGLSCCTSNPAPVGTRHRVSSTSSTEATSSSADLPSAISRPARRRPRRPASGSPARARASRFSTIRSTTLRLPPKLTATLSVLRCTVPH